MNFGVRAVCPGLAVYVLFSTAAHEALVCSWLLFRTLGCFGVPCGSGCIGLLWPLLSWSCLLCPALDCGFACLPACFVLLSDALGGGVA